MPEGDAELPDDGLPDEQPDDDDDCEPDDVLRMPKGRFVKEVSEATICVVDSGLFFPLCQRLAKGFKRVLFHNTSTEAFPTLARCIIGDGFPEVEMVDDFWSIKHDIDGFCFPDIHNSGLQLELESQGFPVWGSRTGDELELDRELFHKTLKKLGLKSPTYKVVVGLLKLAEHLVDEENKFIKISRYRGDMETRKWRNWDLDSGWLDELAVKWGPAKEEIRFLVVDPIDSDLEIGADTYCVRGQYPERIMQGWEWKDKGYIGTFQSIEDSPDDIQEVLQAFAPILAERDYANLWSLELRGGIFLDPCCRFPSPASGSEMMMYANFPEVIWHGANGELIQPEESAKFSAECIMTAKGDKKTWTIAGEIKESLQDHMKCGACCEINGMLCFPPDGSDGSEIGWLVATGETLPETIEAMHNLADSLPDGVEADTDALVDLLKEIQQAEEEGIEFTDETVPEPETALNL